MRIYLRFWFADVNGAIYFKKNVSLTRKVAMKQSKVRDVPEKTCFPEERRSLAHEHRLEDKAFTAKRKRNCDVSFEPCPMTLNQSENEVKPFCPFSVDLISILRRWIKNLLKRDDNKVEQEINQTQWLIECVVVTQPSRLTATIMIDTSEGWSCWASKEKLFTTDASLRWWIVSWCDMGRLAEFTWRNLFVRI